ncbi:hypothetical protein AC579_1660 [Pseudocercospora musae]|uniref:Uncharacterized protein n=1 Tax=Pseudocercospora musae TaxID=113226 RepID=A0A139HIH3_9PEZI|nr:hypothetical protein AC579_1660 [Pseudocercospora musae]
MEEYWRVLKPSYAYMKLILRAWINRDLRASEGLFERYVNDQGPHACLLIVLDAIPDDHPEIKIKAMEIVFATLYEKYGFNKLLLDSLWALSATQATLNWRLAEIILRYSGAKPVDYLKRLTDALNCLRRRRDMESIDFLKPSLSILNNLTADFDARGGQSVSCLIHVITKAWLDLILQDDTGRLELGVSDILKFREDFGGLPKLRFSVDAAAMAQMAGSAIFKSLRPKSLGLESESSLDASRNGTRIGSEQAGEDQPASQSEDEHM